MANVVLGNNNYCWWTLKVTANEEGASPKA